VEVDGVGDMGSEDTTVVDVATPLEGSVNTSLRSVCFTDETCGCGDLLSQLLKYQDFWSITFQIKGGLLYCLPF
jgi:hypothetical protein